MSENEDSDLLMRGLDQGSRVKPVLRGAGEPVSAAADTVSLRETGQSVEQTAAGFGEMPKDYDLSQAPKIEPIALYLTQGIARETFDKWFRLDLEETEQEDPDFDEKIQARLQALKAKSMFSKCLEQARTFDYCLLVGGFDDVATTAELQSELAPAAALKTLWVYAKDRVMQIIEDNDPESQRFGQPLVYVLDRGKGSQLSVHWTRCYRLEVGSILKPLWGDLTSLRNIRWSLGQILYRVGIGFPVVKTPAKTPEQLEEWSNTSLFKDIMHRSSIMLGEGMDFKFEGASQTQLNPDPFYKQSLEAVSIASGIPEPTLRGTQIGAVTGSEVNERGKYSTISRIQGDCEEMIRWVVDHLVGNYAVEQSAAAPSSAADAFTFKAKWLGRRLSQWLKQTPPSQRISYAIEWLSSFELSPLDQSRCDLNRALTAERELQWKTVDEVRVNNGLWALGGSKEKPEGSGEGNVVLGIKGLTVKSTPTGQPTLQTPEGEAQRTSEGS